MSVAAGFLRWLDLREVNRVENPDLTVALNEIDRRLRARRAALAGSLGPGAHEGAGASPCSGSGPVWAGEPGGGGLAGSVADGASRELAAIDAALDGLSRGVYGTCRACHRPIEPARLLTAPLADRCGACAPLSATTAASPRPAPGPGA